MVVDQRHDPQAKLWRLTVAPSHLAGVCPDCGGISAVRHQTPDRERLRSWAEGRCLSADRPGVYRRNTSNGSASSARRRVGRRPSVN
ncbi:MAG: hypothetical protein H0T47_04610 [Planctomycetaceae bacterium]|nr:hypothetical protein [Planctomycetaceae bacterium]